MGAERLAPPARLRRADRVRSSKDYRRLARQGRRRAGPHFVIVSGPGWDPARARLGLTVSRRVGSAVARNRVKRRVREWFRRERVRVPAGTDWVVIARRGAAELDTAATWSELEALAGGSEPRARAGGSDLEERSE